MNSMQVTQDLGKRIPAEAGDSQAHRHRHHQRRRHPVGVRQPGDRVRDQGRDPRSECRTRGAANAAGASRGIDSGANTVGFGFSGLDLYALPVPGSSCHTTPGRSTTWAARSHRPRCAADDVIFWGPGGSRHVAIFPWRQGDRSTPYGSFVKISPVRTSGMTPFVVRYIEW